MASLAGVRGSLVYAREIKRTDRTFLAIKSSARFSDERVEMPGIRVVLSEGFESSAFDGTVKKMLLRT
jgi:hypothetical protein